MNDLIEIQYQIGEFRAMLAKHEPNMQRLKSHIDDLKRQIAKLQAQLADKQVAYANGLDAMNQINDWIAQYEAMIPLYLSEPDATATLKSARNTGPFNPVTHEYVTKSKYEWERFAKAIRTVGGNGSRWERLEDGEMVYTVKVDRIPESYREFLYGVEQGSES